MHRKIKAKSQKNKRTMSYHYTIILRSEPEGGFTAMVPALPGCVTYGRTMEEAKKMLKDAVVGYVASLVKHKEPVPMDGLAPVAFK